MPLPSLRFLIRSGIVPRKANKIIVDSCYPDRSETIYSLWKYRKPAAKSWLPFLNHSTSVIPMNTNQPFEDLSKATRALKEVLEAQEETIQKLPPLERMLASQIRKEFKKGGSIGDDQ